jgi:hypothetical protein
LRLRHYRRCPLDWLLCRSQRDERYTDDCEHDHSHQFSAFDHIPVFLRCHHSGMRKIRPSGESDQAAVRGWVTHSQQQENAECDMMLIIIATAGSREKTWSAE